MCCSNPSVVSARSDSTMPALFTRTSMPLASLQDLGRAFANGGKAGKIEYHELRIAAPNAVLSNRRPHLPAPDRGRVMITSAPNFERAEAVARPIPELAPVMTTVFPVIVAPPGAGSSPDVISRPDGRRDHRWPPTRSSRTRSRKARSSPAANAAPLPSAQCYL